MKQTFFFSLLCLSFIFNPAVFAKGVPSYFTIQGANMPPLLVFFDEAIIFDSAHQIPTPTNIEGEMFVIRAFDIVDSQVIESQLSPMHYYPQVDGTGIIFFVGAQDRGIGQEFDNNWYLAKADTSRILNRYIYFEEIMKTFFDLRL